MLVHISVQFRKDLDKLKIENPKFVSKTMELIFSAIEAVEQHNNPLHGLGRAESLRGNLSGCYSRQITEKHRLIYSYSENKDIIILLSCFGHYSD